MLEKIKTGDENAILEGVTHKGAIYRINALIYAVRNAVDSEKVKEKIYDLQNDKVSVDGYKVSDFALAALDLLGIEKYTGINEQIKALIESRLIF